MADQGNQAFRTAFCFFGLLILAPVVQGIQTSCDVRASGQSGDLTCAFGDDVGQLHRGFVVLRYALNHTDNSEVKVLNCYWLPNGLECIALDGYEYDRDVSTMFFAHMPQVTPQMEGRYLCQVVGNDDKDDKMCNFTYTAPPAKETSTYSPTALSVELQAQTDMTGPSNRSDRDTVIVLSVFFGLVTTWALLITLVFICRKRGAGNLPFCDKAIAKIKRSDGEKTDVEQPILPGNEIEDWGERKSLASEAIRALKDEGFTTVNQLRNLTDGEIQECFQKKHKLQLANYLALKNVLGEHSGVSHLAGSSLRLHEDSNAEQPVLQVHTPQPPPDVDENSSQKMRVSTSQEDHTSENQEHFRFLLFGKTGSGKSTTGNTILGEEQFSSAIAFDSVTRKCQLKRSNRKGMEIEIMDSPGLYDISRPEVEICTDIAQAVACMHPGPTAILYVVSLGRYTLEDFNAYRHLKALFDERILNYIIVLFTGGDQLERENKCFTDMMKNAPKELRQVLRECGNRSIVFNNMASNLDPQVEDLVECVRKIKQQNGNPYVCPKYEAISETLEKEVAVRLAMIRQNELGRNVFAKELERKFKAEEDLRKEIEQIEAKERLWKGGKANGRRDVAEEEPQRLPRDMQSMEEERKTLETKLKEAKRRTYKEMLRVLQDKFAESKEFMKTTLLHEFVADWGTPKQISPT